MPCQNVYKPTWSDLGGFITVTFKRPMKEPSGNYDPQNWKDDSGNTNPEGQKSSNDPLNTSLEGQVEPLNAISEPLKRLILLAIMEDKSITQEKLSIKACVSKSAIKRKFKKWNIFWKGHSKTGHWIITETK